MRNILYLFLVFWPLFSIAQVGIGTPAPEASAQLEVKSTTKGFLPPRMTSAQRTAISSPTVGLMAYQTDGTAGLYYYDGSSWIYIINATSNTLPVANGGTGATTAAGAIASLGVVASTEKGANNGIATLGADGKIPSNQIPAVSFQSANVVASEAAMLGLSGAVVGSIAIRTDINRNFVLSAADHTLLSNWIQLATPSSVTSVNGNTGPNVTLTPSILGATTIGNNLFTLTNPGAISFPRFNANNTVSALSAADFRTAIGVGTGNGSVTSVGLATGVTGNDVNISGSPITSSGTITLNIPDASSTARGLVTTGAQTFEGAKTFSVAPVLSTTTASQALFTDANKNVVSNAITGTGSVVMSSSPTLTTPNLGVPSTLTLTNATGLPISTGISGLGSGVATFLGTPSSANLAAALTNETGSGVLVFGTSPTISLPTITSGSDQFPSSLSISPTTHATSKRAAIWIDGWSLLQDINGNGTKDFSIGQTVSGTYPSRLYINTSGNLGIGNTAPNARLDIRTSPNSTTDPGEGYAGIGTTATAANTAGAGAIRYNTSGVLEYSNGSSWITLAAPSFGDIKSGIQTSDHNGWVKLDGRAKSTLTASQQTQANALGIGANLPDATNAYLVQNGTSLGSVSGSNERTISQANLPSYNLPTTTTSSAGSHTHTGTTNTTGAHTHSLSVKFSSTDSFWQVAYLANNAGFTNPGPSTTTSNGNHSHTLDIDSNGTHTHTVSVSSGGSGTAINIAPRGLSVNTFIYLGL